MHRECDGCELYTRATRMVWPRGPADSPLVLVGEGPGEEEDLSGQPFVGPAGQILNRALAEAFEGTCPDPYIMNVVMCRNVDARGRTDNPEPSHIDACVPRYFQNLIRQHPHKVIVALGAKAWSVLCPLDPQSRRAKPPTIRHTNAVAMYNPYLEAMVIPTFHPAAAIYKASNYPALVSGLQSARRVLEGTTTPIVVSTRVIPTMEDALVALASVPDGSEVWLDLETTGLDPRTDSITMISVGWAPQQSFQIDWARIYRDAYNAGQAAEAIVAMREALVSLFGRCHNGNQNVKFDGKFLFWHFRDKRLLVWDDDTLLEHFSLDENSGHGLKSLSAIFLQASDYEFAMKAQAIDRPNLELHQEFGWTPYPIDGQIKWVPTTALAEYAGRDVEAPRQLHHLFLPELKKQGLETAYRNISLPMVPILARAELRGIHVDRGVAIEYRKVLLEEEEAATERLRSVAGPEFNPNSDSQVRQLLFQQWGVPQDIAGLRRTPKNNYVSVDYENLRIIDRAVASTDLSYWLRQIKRVTMCRKYRGTFIEGILGRLDHNNDCHTTFIQAPDFDAYGKDEGGAVTHRLSSSNPNLQNIPKVMRPIFVARDNYYFLDIDVQQNEMRGWALYSDDPMLLAAVTSSDMHCAVARILWPELLQYTDEIIKTQWISFREDAKTTGFAAVYQATDETLADRANCTVERAHELRLAIQHQFPRGWQWTIDIVNFARAHGYVESYTGRRRRLPDILSNDNKARQEAERQAVNTPVQSVGADVHYTGLIQTQTWLEAEKLDMPLFVPMCMVVNTVHDGALYETHEKVVDKVEESLAEHLYIELRSAEGNIVPFPVEVKRINRWGGDPDLGKLREFIDKEANKL